MRQSTTLAEIISTVETMSAVTDTMLRKYNLFFIAAFRGSFRLLYSKYYLSLCEAVSLYTAPHIEAINNLNNMYGLRDNSYKLIYEKDEKGVVLTDTIYVCIRLKKVCIKPEDLPAYTEQLRKVNEEYTYLQSVIDSYLNATITVELVKIEKEWLPEDISPVLLNNIKILL